MSVTNFTVFGSSVELSLTPLDEGVLNDAFITVSGTINVSDHKIWVNGVEVTNLSDGYWSVEGVPLPEGGTAVVQVRAIPLTDNDGNGSGVEVAKAFPSIILVIRLRPPVRRRKRKQTNRRGLSPFTITRIGPGNPSDGLEAVNPK